MTQARDIQLAERAERIARLMDNSFRVPLTRITFGWDSILGLVPGVGDALALAPSLRILHLSHQAGAPASLRNRMLINIGVDWVIGLVPLLGDIFDLGYKANLRNAALLRAHVEAKALSPEPGPDLTRAASTA